MIISGNLTQSTDEFAIDSWFQNANKSFQTARHRPYGNEFHKKIINPSLSSNRMEQRAVNSICVIRFATSNRFGLLIRYTFISLDCNILIVHWTRWSSRKKKRVGPPIPSVLLENNEVITKNENYRANRIMSHDKNSKRTRLPSYRVSQPERNRLKVSSTSLSN